MIPKEIIEKVNKKLKVWKIQTFLILALNSWQC
jgi:predicted nucleic acid-binding Zn ribbon protein